MIQKKFSKIRRQKIKDDSIVCFIVKANVEQNLQIFHKCLTDYVIAACEKYLFYQIDEEKTSVFETIKNKIKPNQTVVLLPSNIPLLTSATLQLTLDYFVLRKSTVLQLQQGFILSAKEILQGQPNLQTSDVFLPHSEDFFAVHNVSDCLVATERLQARILTRLALQKVKILCPKQVVIEPDVTIGNQVTIYPQNVLIGNTHIGNHTTLLCGNIIQNSKIACNCTLFGTHLIHCTVLKNTNLVGTLVAKNCTLPTDLYKC